MATQPPKKDDTHGEEQVTPRFGGGQEPGEQSFGKVYDDQGPQSDNLLETDKYNDRQFSPTASGSRDSDPDSPRQLDDKEKAAGSGSSGSIDSSEQSFMDRIGSITAAGKAKREAAQGGSESFYRNEGSGGLFGRLTSVKGLSGKVKPKHIATSAIIGLLAGGGFYSVAILSGPFQFIHFAQHLQKHFKPNDDFGNDRTSKVLLYALAGQGGQNGRLGVVGNKVATKWEKKLIDETGMRPVYQEGTRRFVGYEIVDDNKAQRVLGDIGEQEGRRANKLQQTMGRGAEIRQVGNVGLYNSDNNTQRIEGSKRFVDLRSVSFADRRVWINTITNATETNGVSSRLGARVLKQRAGVTLHPVNKAKGKIDAAAAKALEDRREKTVSNGVTSSSGELKPQPGPEDDEGNATAPNQADVEASAETKSYFDEFKQSGSFKTAKSAAIVTGVLCLAKAFGNNVEDYRYTNTALPMIRSGMFDVALGNQAMSGDDIDLETMGVFTKALYDEETKTSVGQAASIRAANGKTGGVELPREADLGNVGEKPRLFRIIDGIPVLGTVCDVQNAIGNLPIIKQIGDASSAALEESASAVGVNLDDLTESAVKAVAGKGVDPSKKGGVRGAISDTGTFLAAGDASRATGGHPLTDGERANIAALNEYYEQQDRANKPMLARYFDPFDQKSIAGTMIGSAPVSATQAADMVSNPVRIIGSSLSSLTSTFTPKVGAQEARQYDYGFPMIGRSLTEMRDPLYENPYENGQRSRSDDDTKELPKLEDDLDRLNEQYGKICYGTTVTTGADGVHIKLHKENTPNPFEVLKKHPECDVKTNRNDRLSQYSMYLGDAFNLVTLDCYDGNEEACAEIGVNVGNNNDPTATTSEPAEVDGDFKIKKLKNTLPGVRGGGEIEPKGIVLHWWSKQYNEGIKGLTDIFKKNGLSVQVGITSDGQVYQLTDKLTTKTSHASGANSTTIGIEIEGGPNEFGKEGIEEYPEKFEAVVQTVKYLTKKYNIPLEKNVSCNDVSGVIQHKELNKCSSTQKQDIDDYYYNEVMKRVRQ